MALQRTGLFPAARAGYRMVNPRIRNQRFREINFYSTFLKPDALCFDIGANLGQKAEVFLSCAKRVIIVEPNVLCQPTLSYLFGRNPNAEVLMTAVGSTPGWMKLYVHGTDSTASARPEWDRQVYGSHDLSASSPCYDPE
jgi:hypothetical protein